MRLNVRCDLSSLLFLVSLQSVGGRVDPSPRGFGFCREARNREHSVNNRNLGASMVHVGVEYAKGARY